MNEIMKGIVQKIRTKYPQKQYSVYTEAVEQGLKEPCFFVFQITQSQLPMLGSRYKENSSFVVQYLTQNRAVRQECNTIAQELYGLLEYVESEGEIFHGTAMYHEIQDGILYFYADYNHFILRPKEPEEYMRKVEVYGKSEESRR